MSITDELRKYVQSWRETPNIMDDLDAGDIDGLLGDFIAIADRIDAEHERELREAGEDIVRDVRREWVRLPLDADGEPVHIGDVMAWGWPAGGTFEVIGIGDGVLFYDDGAGEWTCANCYHHAPTVEDVLREFVDALDIDRCEDFNATIADFAAKLQLRGDAE